MGGTVLKGKVPVIVTGENVVDDKAWGSVCMQWSHEYFYPSEVYLFSVSSEASAHAPLRKIDGSYTFERWFS